MLLWLDNESDAIIQYSENLIIGKALLTKAVNLFY